MPGYKKHLIGGLAAFAVVHTVLQKPLTPNNLLVPFTCSLLGSLFPDVDTKSVGQKLFYYIMAGLTAFTVFKRWWGVLSATSLISLFPLLVNHRGIIHTIWFVTLVPLAGPIIIAYSAPHFASLCWNAYIYFVAGALSHLLLDRYL